MIGDGETRMSEEKPALAAGMHMRVSINGTWSWSLANSVYAL